MDHSPGDLFCEYMGPQVLLFSESPLDSKGKMGGFRLAYRARSQSQDRTDACGGKHDAAHSPDYYLARDVRQTASARSLRTCLETTRSISHRRNLRNVYLSRRYSANIPMSCLVLSDLECYTSLHIDKKACLVRAV
jgi:hypothetical protein